MLVVIMKKRKKLVLSMKRLIYFLIETFILLLIPLCLNAEKNRTFEEAFQDALHFVDGRFFRESKIEFFENDISDIKRLYGLLNDDESSEEYARICYLDAFANYYSLIPDYDYVDELLDKSMKVLTKEVSLEYYGRLVFLKGALNRRSKFEYAEAYKLLEEARTVFSSLNNDLYLAKTYQQLGLLWADLQDYDKAMEYYDLSENLFRNTAYNENCYYLHCNKCVIYSLKGEYERAVNIMRNDIEFGENRKDTAFLFVLYHNIGLNNYNMGKYDVAYSNYKKAQSLVENSKKPNNDYKTLIYSSLAKYYNEQMLYNEALASLLRGHEYASVAGMKYMENSIDGLLYKVYGKLGRYKESYEVMSRYERMSDSLNFRSKIQEVQRMKYQDELNVHKQQLRIAEQESAIRLVGFLVVLLSLLLAVGVIVFICYANNKRRKLRDLEQIRLSQQLSEEEMRNNLQRMEYEKLVKEKEREIVTAKLLVAEKNKLLELLSDTFRPFYQSGELSDKIWNEIGYFIRSNKRKDKEWDDFKIHFEKVDPDFFKKLKTLYPSLTENELHICSYIKMGMRAKQIASMLSVNQASVITCRYRIKKKMSLQDDSLDDFIRNI